MLHALVLPADTEEPHCCVVEACAKHGGLRLNVDAPATIWVLQVGQVADDFLARLLLNVLLCDVHDNRIPGQQEHGPAVVASPVPCRSTRAMQKL